MTLTAEHINLNAKYDQTAAARCIGVSYDTIHRAVKSGGIRFTVGRTGKTWITGINLIKFYNQL